MRHYLSPPLSRLLDISGHVARAGNPARWLAMSYLFGAFSGYNFA